MFVDLPLGHTTGLPGDRTGQRAMLVDGLRAGHAIDEPGSIIDRPYSFVDDDWKANPLGWSRKRQDRGAAGSASGDTRTDRSPEPRYQLEADRRAAEAISEAEQCRSCLGLG